MALCWRGGEGERETGANAPTTNAPCTRAEVEFVYRLARAGGGRGQARAID